MSEIEIEEILKIAQQEKDTTMQETLNEAEQSQKQNHLSGTGEILNEADFTKDEKNKSLIPYADSEAQLVNFEGVKSHSMSLIDDSIEHLHGLMKCVGNNVKERAKSNDRIGTIDPQVVNAACNVAREMGNILKIKLDYHVRIKRK